MLRRVEDWLSVGELRTDVRLRILCAFLNLFGFATFARWYGDPSLSTFGAATFDFVPAWPVLGLPRLIVLDPFWTRSAMAGLCLISVLGFMSALAGRALLPLLTLAAVFSAKLYYYLNDVRLFAPDHHIHLILSFFFLVARSKLYFARLALLLCFHWAAFAKLTPSWLEGELFAATADGLPLLPKSDGAVRLACRAWTLAEFLGPAAWFLESRTVRLGSVALLAGLQLYLTLCGAPRQGTVMLAALLAAFLPFDKPVQAERREARRDRWTWAALGALYLGGLLGPLIPGDVRLTGEGRALGLAPVDANRATRFTAELRRGDRRLVLHAERPFAARPLEEEDRRPKGAVTAELYERWDLIRAFEPRQIIRDRGAVVWNARLFTEADDRSFGDPYLYYAWAREVCRRYRPDRLSLLLEQRLDGKEERHRVLDLPDFCGAAPRYFPIWHNAWINQ